VTGGNQLVLHTACLVCTQPRTRFTHEALHLQYQLGSSGV